MASGIYNRFKGDIMAGVYDLNGTDHSVKCNLMTNSHTFNADHDSWADVSANEISTGGNYTQNTKTLSNMTVTCDDTNDLGKFNADDVTWASSTITAYHAVLFDDTPTTPTADPLICSIDFGGVKSSSNGNFTIQWDNTDNAIIKIA